jgi:hypothetical protein
MLPLPRRDVGILDERLRLAGEDKSKKPSGVETVSRLVTDCDPYFCFGSTP